MAPNTVLITGANRGLGKGLTERFLSQPNHIVIAALRDPSHSTSQALSSLAKGEGSKLIVVKYDAAIEKDAQDVVEALKTSHGIEKLDVVIANAAIVKAYLAAKDAQRADILEHLNVNVFGVLSLFQATRNLLQEATKEASSGKPVFAIIGSVAGSMGQQPPVPNSLYGASKSMVHWYGVRIHHEEEWLSSLVIHPGWVQTEMGNLGARGFGLKEAPVKVDDSVNGMFDLVTDPGSREKYGGKLVTWEREIIAW